MATGADSSPTLLRMELRSTLRGHRLRLHLLGEDVTRLIQEAFAGSFSQAKLSRIESGQQLPSPRDVSDLAHIYDLDRDERDRLVQLAKDAKRQGWWEKYDAADVEYQTFIDYESAAVSMRNYESTFVPGLLQVPAYAQAVIGKLADHDERERAELVEVRLRRQDRLTGENPIRLHVIMQENALRRTVGGPDVMLEQIDHLRKMCERPNVAIQIIRFNAGLYLGLKASAFVLLDFEDPETMQTACYVEGILGNLFAQDRQRREAMESAFAEMRDEIAVPVADTPDLLAEIRGRVAREKE